MSWQVGDLVTVDNTIHLNTPVSTQVTWVPGTWELADWERYRQVAMGLTGQSGKVLHAGTPPAVTMVCVELSGVSYAWFDSAWLHHTSPPGPFGTKPGTSNNLTPPPRFKVGDLVQMTTRLATYTYPFAQLAGCAGITGIITTVTSFTVTVTFDQMVNGSVDCAFDTQSACILLEPRPVTASLSPGGWFNMPTMKLGPTLQPTEPPKPKRDFVGFCDPATHPEFRGWCGRQHFHSVGCPTRRPK